jgi:hypothetical protein
MSDQQPQQQAAVVFISLASLFLVGSRDAVCLLWLTAVLQQERISIWEHAVFLSSTCCCQYACTNDIVAFMTQPGVLVRTFLTFPPVFCEVCRSLRGWHSWRSKCLSTRTEQNTLPTVPFLIRDMNFKPLQSL